ncbi:MAG: CapA family protein [Coriobacteriia bacterium]
MAIVIGLGSLAWARRSRGPTPDAAPPVSRAASPTPSPASSTVSHPTSAPVTAPVPAVAATLTVAGVGDMIFDRNVALLVRDRGGAAPLASVAGLLARADVTAGNLESPLSVRGERFPGKDVTFRGDPRAVAGLRAAGFDFISLANNHVLDYGGIALTDTVSTLDEAGIAHAGAGADSAAARRPALVSRRGARVAYLAFSHVLPPGFVADADSPGLAPGRGRPGEVAAAVRAAKRRADYVVVSFHWGVEYSPDATAEQVRDARRAIDAGADLVLAHHPHVIQGVERYHGGLIAYSLGDFVFDHYSRETGEAFVLTAEVGPSGVGSVGIVPVYLDGHGAPAVVTGTAAQRILERLRRLSAARGTRIVISGDRAEVAR